MERATSRSHTPRITKKLLCFVCRVFFTSVLDKVKDKDVYKLDSKNVENWQLKAFEYQTRFIDTVSYPVFCRSCETEIGFCQNGHLYLNRFRIKHVENPPRKDSLSCFV